MVVFIGPWFYKVEKYSTPYYEALSLMENDRDNYFKSDDMVYRIHRTDGVQVLALKDNKGRSRDFCLDDDLTLENFRGESYYHLVRLDEDQVHLCCANCANFISEQDDLTIEFSCKEKLADITSFDLMDLSGNVAKIQSALSFKCAKHCVNLDAIDLERIEDGLC
jgi:hypothetical protein